MLDLLSLPAAPRIDFTRTVAIGTAAADDSAPRRSNNTFSEHINRACWWPIIEGAPEENVRSLRGEIDIPRNAKPGFLFPRFSVRVSCIFLDLLLLLALTLLVLYLSLPVFCTWLYAIIGQRENASVRKSHRGHRERAWSDSTFACSPRICETTGRELEHVDGVPREWKPAILSPSYAIK